MSLNQLAANQTAEDFFMVKLAENAVCKNGIPYQKVTLTERGGVSYTINNFNVAIPQEVRVVKATIKADAFNNGISFAMVAWERIDTNDLSIFAPMAQIDIQATWNYVVGKIQALRPGLRNLVSNLIMSNCNAYANLPLSPVGAYARNGGLLEETSFLMAIAESVANIQKLDKDLMIAGAAIYHFGNAFTIDESYNYSSNHILFGESAFLFNTIMNTASQIQNGSDEQAKADLNQEDIKLLAHIALTSTGNTKPVIPEAIALKAIDKMYIEVESSKNALMDIEAGKTTYNNKSLEYKSLYKKAV